MSAERDPLARLLRWYPAAWRERYGDEFVAFMNDDLEGRRPTWSYRRRVATAGLRERALDVGLVGRTVAPAERRRVGSLVVLVSWGVMVLAGASYEKVSEHSAQALAPTARTGAQVAYDLVVGFGVAGVALVAAGALAALPSLRRFLATGGWESLRAHVVRAVALSILAGAGVVFLATWAHRLTGYQRNGGDGAYSAAFALLAILAAVTLGQWTAVAVATGRRLVLSDRTLRLESVLAVGVGAAIVGIAASASVWWVTMARDAPAFLTGSAGGSPSIVTPNLVVTMGLMAFAVATSLMGVARIVGARDIVASQLSR